MASSDDYITINFRAKSLATNSQWQKDKDTPKWCADMFRHGVTASLERHGRDKISKYVVASQEVLRAAADIAAEHLNPYDNHDHESFIYDLYRATCERVDKDLWQPAHHFINNLKQYV